MLLFFSPVAAPSPFIACQRKQALIRAYLRAVSDYWRVQCAQVLAVTNGEDVPFEEEIAAAALRRENAKFTIMAHIEEHG